MAFPVVETTAVSGNSATTSHVVTLPAGVAEGDLLLFVINISNLPTVTDPAGWIALFTSPLPSNQGRFRGYYRIADGTEGASITVTTSNNQSSGAIAYRISGDNGGAPEVSTAATGSSAAPDPTSLTPSWGAADTLWLACMGANIQTSGVKTYPTNYTSGIDASGSRLMMSAERSLNAASEDPSAFGLSVSPSWVAHVIAIQPAPSNTAPTVEISENTSIGSTIYLPVGASFDFTATADDAEDGDLTASIGWSVSDALVLSITGAATGGSTTVKKIGAGSAQLLADVSDSSDTPATQASVTITDPATGGGFDKARFIIHALGGII